MLVTGVQHSDARMCNVAPCSATSGTTTALLVLFLVLVVLVVQVGDGQSRAIERHSSPAAPFAPAIQLLVVVDSKAHHALR